MSDEIMTKLADAISRLTELQEKQLATKAPALANSSTLLHGPGGIWSVSGLERDIITAHIRPVGLGAQLNAFPSVYTDPRFGSLTGYTATVGSEPAYPCSDAPAGYVKSCMLTAQFGRVARQTQTIEIDQVILKLHRGDFTDLNLRGAVLGDQGEFNMSGMSQADILNVVTKSEMVGVGVQIERWLTNMLWQGNPANNNAGGGYKEFPGLDRQIATGQMDADTQTLCPALDSDVKSFAYNDVCGTGLDIVEYVSMMEYYLRFNAERMGLMPTTWIIVMRPGLWHELTKCWPCRYNTSGCTIKDSANIDAVPQIDAADMTRLRDEMRRNMVLDINGHSYQVVVDDGIFEHNNVNNANLKAGEYASSLYFVPIKITGNFPVTYWEYVDYRQAQSDMSLLNGMETFWSDNGRFFWALEQIKWCYTLTAKVEPRVILRTPQLAGKIQYIKYSPLQHTREFDPSSSYFADGGVSLRAKPTSYAVWGNR